jgi:predicted O-linked N-acetylglucosamine transferase (SPINDLY family)
MHDPENIEAAVVPGIAAGNEDREQAVAHYTLSTSLLTQGNLDQALPHALQAVKLQPGDALYSRFVGELFARQGNFDEADAWLAQAVSEAPEELDGYLIRYTVLASIERHEEALEMIRTAAILVSDEPDIFDKMAATCRILKKGEEAFVAARRALDLTPSNVERAIALSDVLLDALQYDQAAELMWDYQGDDAENAKSRIVEAAGKFRSLNERFLAMLDQSPETTLFTSDFIESILKLCDWEKSQAFVDRLIEIIAKNIELGRPIGMSVNNLQAFPVSYEFIANAARGSANTIIEGLKDANKLDSLVNARPVATARHGHRIRLGYLVTFVHFHSLPLLLKHIMDRHDRDRFEVFGYCVGHVIEDDFSPIYRASFDQFTACGDDPDATARTIRDDEIDILIDVTGQGVGSCLDVIARRPAPLAVHYLGYSITTGADFIDYIVTDEIYLQDQDIRVGTEQPLYLPHTFMAAVPMETSGDVPTREECGLPENGTVFCNFNQMFKLEPEIFRSWCTILRAVEGSVLWLGGWSSAAVHNLRRTAAAHGVDPQRLVFGSIVDHVDHLARLAHADLCLDTFHHGGGVTTIDCLWVGVPVLTTRGNTPSSRLGNSILHGAGLDHLVVNDRVEYEARAIELGNSTEKLVALRKDWQAQKPTSPLFDIDRYVEHLEIGYDGIWQHALAGKAPTAMTVPPMVKR